MLIYKEEDRNIVWIDDTDQHNFSVLYKLRGLKIHELYVSPKLWYNTNSELAQSLYSILSHKDSKLFLTPYPEFDMITLLDNS